MVATPEIVRSTLGGEKDTVSCFSDREEEPNEKEEPRKRI